MRRISICLLVAACLAAPGCRLMKPTGWMAQETASLGRFESPASAVVDPATGMAYVACRGPVVLDPDTGGGPAPSAEPSKAYISRLRPGGIIDNARWRESTADLPLGRPRGMCILDGQLYVAGAAHIVVYPLTGDKPGRVVTVPGATRLAGMATDGAAAYVADTDTWKVYRLKEDGPPAEIKAPPAVTGICFLGKRLFAVSADVHDVYELDTSGKAEPTPLGLGKEFKGPDAIQALDDGSLVVGDEKGHQVVLVGPDRKTVRVVARVSSPAVAGLDAKRKLLYVPLPASGRVTVYRLEKK